MIIKPSILANGAISPISRSHSQPEFNTHERSYLEYPSKSMIRRGPDAIILPSGSPTPSAPSSPRALHADSTASSYRPTPARGLEDGLQELPARLRRRDSCTVSLPSNTSSTILRLESPGPVEYAEDDTVVRTQPLQYVDYLSHSWEEEDIWLPRRHVAWNRKANRDGARLENASWRVWTRLKNKLKTVSPESLNWLKDSDLTWLYGPLQSGSDSSLRMISNSNSFLNKRPILKNISISEMMLQGSLSESSLLKQAVASLQAQKLRESGRGCHQPGAGWSTFDVTSPFSLRRITRENEKHIQFNEQVERCIALEVNGDTDEELDSSSRMATSRASLGVDSKTIAMLPSTTLKDEEDTLELAETAVKHNNFFFGEDLGDDDANTDWQSPDAFPNSKDSMVVTQERLQNLHTPGSSSSLNGISLGITHTPSGMFMPDEEDQGDVVSNGLFAKVANLVDIAKDIAYVFWNVGRKGSRT